MTFSCSPFFSVIVPTYNREATIESVLLALENQTFTDFEIIVVNDGSSDNTAKILSKVENAKIRVFNQTNQGCSMARRAGCIKAKGTYLAFCDSDDIWAPNYLQSLHQALLTHPTDVIFTNYSVNGESKPRIAGQQAENWLDKWTKQVNDELYLFEDNVYFALLDWQPTFPSAFAINREFYQKIGGISEHLAHMRSEDAHLTRRAAAYGSFSYLAKPLVTLGRQDDNLSSSYLENLKGGAEILCMLIEDEDIPERLFKPTQEEINRHYLAICDQAFWQGKYCDSWNAARALSVTNWSLRTWRNAIISFFKKSSSTSGEESEELATNTN